MQLHFAKIHNALITRNNFRSVELRQVWLLLELKAGESRIAKVTKEWLANKTGYTTRNITRHLKTLEKCELIRHEGSSIQLANHLPTQNWFPAYEPILLHPRWQDWQKHVLLFILSQWRSSIDYGEAYVVNISGKKKASIERDCYVPRSRDKDDRFAKVKEFIKELYNGGIISVVKVATSKSPMLCRLNLDALVEIQAEIDRDATVRGAAIVRGAEADTKVRGAEYNGEGSKDTTVRGADATVRGASATVRGAECNGEGTKKIQHPSDPLENPFEEPHPQSAGRGASLGQGELPDDQMTDDAQPGDSMILSPYGLVDDDSNWLDELDDGAKRIMEKKEKVKADEIKKQETEIKNLGAYRHAIKEMQTLTLREQERYVTMICKVEADMLENGCWSESSKPAKDLIPELVGMLFGAEKRTGHRLDARNVVAALTDSCFSGMNSRCWAVYLGLKFRSRFQEALTDQLVGCHYV